MSRLFVILSDRLNVIRLAFSGMPIESQSGLNDLREITSEVEDLDIYTWSHDRLNLKNDRSSISSDLKKVVQKKASEISNG